METAELDSKIESLNKAIHPFLASRLDWKAIWIQIRDIGASFKGARYPSKENKDNAWARFQSLVQEVRAKQALEKAKSEKEKGTSEELKELILSKAQAAIPPSRIEEAIASLISAPITIPLNTLLPGSLDETKMTLQSCSGLLSEGWQMLSMHKSQMMGRDKKEAHEALTRTRERLDDAWARWKSVQERRWKEREAKDAAHQDGLRGRIEDLESRRSHLYLVLARKESHLDELHRKRDEARSDNFRSVVEGWIDEEESAIRNIKERIAQVETRVDEARTRLK